MTFEERVDKSKTHYFKAVFPELTNHHNTMHGGEVMKIMDEIAFITATRFCRKGIVTVSCDKVDFNQSLPGGTMMEVIGKVISVGNTSLKVEVKVFIEQMYAEGRIKAIEGVFTLVALDDNKKPITVLG
jgi:acyl-CoA hydrolase|tara:strand:- start:1579 stop:1965 length:387 start_codon:yes stop_codon:yes gene_type:complete